VQGQYPQSYQAITEVKSLGQLKPGIASPQRSRLGGESALSPVASQVPRVLAFPAHPSRSRVASSVLLRARGSCESHASDPSHAAQGDLAKGARGCLVKLAVIVRAWSCPWQHPKRSGLIDPF